MPSRAVCVKFKSFAKFQIMPSSASKLLGHAFLVNIHDNVWPISDNMNEKINVKTFFPLWKPTRAITVFSSKNT